MSKQSKHPRQQPGYELGPDIDLDTEEVYLNDGTRLTEAVAQDLADDVLRKMGRPPLGQKRAPGRSPQITFRTPPALLDAAQQQAAAEGITVSQLARKAVESYLRKSA